MLGRVGLWTAHLDQVPWSRGREIVQEVEALGYSALWFPEAVGRDGLVASTLTLSASQRLVAATGIVSIYGRDAFTMNSAWRTISEAYPDRFILGLGVSHRPMVEGLRGVTYGPPVTAMRHYLDQMDGAPYLAVNPSQPRRRSAEPSSPTAPSVSRLAPTWAGRSVRRRAPPSHPDS